ncbi:MAG TPA: pitrilysin family protein [Steroidobacteraceae bacterium]|nr:pitrilysin family protein [Steroidobacteraceae bacterium]
MRTPSLSAWLAAALVVIAAAPAHSAPAAAQPAGASFAIPNVDKIEKLTLDNGLTILVWPDFDIPNVALYNWVRVGSRNEAPGITGLAHFFEHMMFNGTSRRQPGEFDRIMEANGGANNASTNDDVTIYQDWFPRAALEVIFDLEADRLQNLAFTPAVIDSERGVVYSERRLRVEDDNNGMLFEQVQSTAFVAHPYQFPTIGWPSDIKSWSLQDLQTFFRTYYAPNNQTMVFAGAVEPKEIFALARKYLAPIPRQDAPDPVRTVEPEQMGERRVLIEADAQTPLLHLAYHGLAAADARMPAAQLLISILTEGDASRLHRLLVEQEKVAIAVQGYLQEGFDPGLFWILATVPTGMDPSRTEGVLNKELERVANEGVTDAELARAKNLFASAFWKQIGTIDGKAELLGRYQTFDGDYRKLFDAPATFEKVTREDVRKVAAELLKRTRRTVGTLVPKPQPADAAAGEG